MITYDTFIFSNNPSGAVNTTSLAGRSVGECLVVQVGWDSGTFVSISLENVAEVNAQLNLGSAWHQRIYVAILTAGDISAGDFDVTFSGAAYSDVISSVLSGVDRVTPVAASSGNSGTGTVLTGLSVTAVRDNSMLLFYTTSGASTRLTGPAGMLNRYTQDTNIYCDSQSVNAGATGNRVSTYGGAQTWLGHMVIVQPPLTDNALFFGGGPL